MATKTAPEPPESGKDVERPDAAAAEAATPAAPETADEPQPPEPGVYEYTYSAACVYPHVPLTCRPATPEQPESDSAPAVRAQSATVFDWPFGPPDDGRWIKTRKKPNQRADNEPPLSSEE